MSGKKLYMRLWRNGLFKSLILLLACLVWTACDNDDDFTFSSEPGPFQLTFSLDESFQGPHGGHQVRMAVVRESDGQVIAQMGGIVSATLNPSFFFDAGVILERGAAYAVHYWIDSNIGGGTPGVCDPKEFDHQWSTEFLFATNDVSFSASYNVNLTENVCHTFD